MICNVYFVKNRGHPEILFPNRWSFLMVTLLLGYQGRITNSIWHLCSVFLLGVQSMRSGMPGFNGTRMVRIQWFEKTNRTKNGYHCLNCCKLSKTTRILYIMHRMLLNIESRLLRLRISFVNYNSKLKKIDKKF